MGKVNAGLTRDCLVSIVYDVLDRARVQSPSKLAEQCVDAMISEGLDVEPSDEDRGRAEAEARAELDEYLLDLHNDRLTDEALGK